MSTTINSIHLFQEIFTGNINAYGQHTPSKNLKPNEKDIGKNWTVKEELTIKQYVNHINGNICLGLIPINDKNEIKFAVIDIDNYNENYVKKLVNKIHINNLPILPFRSKSGGLHLYLFFKSFIQYSKVKEFVKEFIPILALNKEVEIFPKQANLNKTKVGNWINLPYFNANNTKQYLINEDFKPVEFSKALTVIKENMVTEEKISSYFEGVDLNDAPPCLQSILFEKDTDKRNDFLFNLAVYLKSKYGEDFKYELYKYNKELLRPLKNKEIDDTIIKSHKKRDYSYKCNNLPLNEYCLKEVCKNRKYGLGSDEISELSFEDFIQHKTDPPYYEWIVNGISLYFFDETDIINQAKFRALCFRELHILPIRLKDETWTKIINRALKNIIVQESSNEDDISPGSIFLNNLYDFLERRVQAENLNQILIDRVFKDVEQKIYIFKGKNLIDYLFIQKGFRYFRVTEIHNRLKRIGATNERKYLDKNNKNERVWILPFKAIETLKHHIDEGFEINFTKIKEKQSNEQKEENLY